jgi:8-oxo-dGTP pyrophosphatase MutT (NUDIX family)
VQNFDFSSLIPTTPGIIGEETYFQAAVLVPLCQMDGQYHLLFEKRAQGIRQPGEISFPGGKIEKEHGETAIQAALRETQEELGLDASRIDVLGKFHSIVAPHNAIIHCVIATRDDFSLDEIVANPDEVESFFTVPLEYFLKSPPQKYHVRLALHAHTVDGEKVLFPAAELNLPSRYHGSWGNTMVPVYVYDYQGTVIWGITGQIIFALMQRINELSADATGDTGK